MDRGGFHRAESHSGQSGSGNDGQDCQRLAPAASSAGGEVRGNGARCSCLGRSAHCVTSPDARELEKRIDSLAATPQGAELPDDARTTVRELLDALETGRVRAAEKDPASGQWAAVPWVK